jgi:molybdate transport system permease protein
MHDLMIQPAFDWSPIWITLRLASLTVGILIIVGTPLAWWLAFTRSRLKAPVEAVTALPLVLPPTVLGFYLLVFLGPHGPAGSLWNQWFGHPLAFTFTGLVIASCLYSLPFVVQPLQAAFEAMNRKALEASWTLGASRTRSFFTIVVPQARRGWLMALVLGFAHTLGEFGVVLMVGGNIPGDTQVVSISIYEQVEMLRFDTAAQLSAGLLVFSFLVLWTVYAINRRWHGGRLA